MKYDFTSIIDRHGMDSIAVDSWGEIPGMAPNAPDEGFDRIPMWVADMNFATVPTVQEHIIQRAQHPMFGYFNPRPEYFDRIIEWQSRRNGVEGLRPEHIGYENGVLGGVVSTLRAYVQPGDAVLVHSPTYIGFTKSIEAAGYRIVHSPLKLDDQGVWRMDFEDMERKLAQNHIHAAVFCSPHNPCGRVWERDEIERAMDIYRQHDCVVISDEIWSDIILPGHKHIPTQSVSEDARMRTVALYAPSKTFNLAGLVGNLLDMARLHAGQVTLHKEWQPIEEVIGSSIKLLGRALAEHPVKVTLAKGLPLVEFDAVLIESVFCNLLENAAKYSPPGAGVSIDAASRDGMLEVTVSDGGKGFFPANASAVFEMFVRGEAESTKPGVGLGLAICSAIVEAHGGRIRAANRTAPSDPEEIRGARFTVWLPAET
mgnify:CR=1 FL=1